MATGSAPCRGIWDAYHCSANFNDLILSSSRGSCRAMVVFRSDLQCLKERKTIGSIAQAATEDLEPPTQHGISQAHVNFVADKFCD